TVDLYTNGTNTSPQTLALTGSIASGGTYVIRNSSATLAALVAAANTAASVANFNGDDAILLRFGTDTLDIIGNIGCDPGASWNSGSHDMVNKTLIRKSTVQKGVQSNPGVAATCAFPTLVSEWDVFAIDDVTDLGSHTSTCIGAPTGPAVGFATTSDNVAENVTGGTHTVSININNPVAANAYSVDVALATTGTATAGTDFTFTGSTLNWAAGDNTPKTVTITILDDAIVDPAETIILNLTNPSTGLAIGTST